LAIFNPTHNGLFFTECRKKLKVGLGWLGGMYILKLLRRTLHYNVHFQILYRKLGNLIQTFLSA
jgi:hypothetical protein